MQNPNHLNRRRAKDLARIERPLEELSCPSFDVCAWCCDCDCDGISCIAGLDPNDPTDHEAIEQLHDWLRRGQVAVQVERFLADRDGRA